MTLKIENLDPYIATALGQSSLMCLLDATWKACDTNLTSKNWGRAKELNRRWIKRQQCVWDATYAVKIRELDKRWHSKIENLEEHIARAIKQHSLVSVLDAIANACLVKAAQAGDPELQRQWSGRARIVRDAANEIERRHLGDRRTKHTHMLYTEAPNSAGGIDWIRQGFTSAKATVAFDTAKSNGDKSYGELLLMGDCPRSGAVCAIFGKRD